MLGGDVKHERVKRSSRWNMKPAILIVDDAPFVALDLEDAAVAAGFRVIGPCGSVSATLGEVNRWTPACAILDVQLADGPVFPVADFLQDAGVPLIFHSGTSAGDELLDRYPGARFCAKPSQPADLMNFVRQAVDL
jgi:DNA-binding response OmpR family regulator